MEFCELFIPRQGRGSERGALHQRLSAKGKLVLCDIQGSGVIGQLCMTHMNHIEEVAILTCRGVVIRCYWDDEQTPSVEVPLGDFFGIGFGKDRPMDAAAWQRDGLWHLRTLFPMPFKKRARIELDNLTDQDLHGFYWDVEFDEGVQLPDDLEYFHAQYRQSHPVPKNSIHTVLEAEGHGKYVGTVWSVNWLNAGCPPENAFSFFIDGQPVEGPNSEDYFGQSWGFRPDFHTFYLGQGLNPEKTDIGSTQMSSYRVHLPNPRLFQKNLRFTTDNQSYNGGYRTDTYDTVAFWYQSHPRLPFPPLPPLEELLPIQHPESYARGLWEIHARQKDGRPGAALTQAEELVRCWPGNSRTPDVLHKMATLQAQLGALSVAKSIYQRIIAEHPRSGAAADAADRLWLMESPGRLLLTLVTPSGWTAYLDGREVALPAHLFEQIPVWGERVHFRYGRSQCLRMKKAPAKVAPGGDVPIGVVADPYQSPEFESVDNVVHWEDSASSIMRLFTVRLEPGSGRHLLAVDARVSSDLPIRLESQAPGGMVGVLESASGAVVTDGAWKISEKNPEGWTLPSASDESWEYATVYPGESYGDASWFWLHPDGFRKFPAQMQRIWGKDRLCGDQTVRFRRTIEIP